MRSTSSTSLTESSRKSRAIAAIRPSSKPRAMASAALSFGCGLTGADGATALDQHLHTAGGDRRVERAPGRPSAGRARRRCCAASRCTRRLWISDAGALFAVARAIWASRSSACCLACAVRSWSFVLRLDDVGDRFFAPLVLVRGRVKRRRLCRDLRRRGVHGYLHDARRSDACGRHTGHLTSLRAELARHRCRHRRRLNDLDLRVDLRRIGDDEPGHSEQRRVLGGDQQPAARRIDRGRPRTHE